MLGEPMQKASASTSAFYVYVSDVDSMYKRATGAGAKSVSPPTDQFWGDRMATVSDPFGNTWSIATHKEDPTPEEMAKRMAQRIARPKLRARDPPFRGSLASFRFDCKFYRQIFLLAAVQTFAMCMNCNMVSVPN